MKRFKHMHVVLASTILFLALGLSACDQVQSAESDSVAAEASANAKPSTEPIAVLREARGATQISGVSFFDGTDECNPQSQGADFAFIMTGDFEGCLNVFVEDFECSPSGTYREEGSELFIGTYNGEPGTFTTTYNFEGKYEGCAVDGSFLGAEIFGRCQHPIAEGSGGGVFDGVTGRFNIKDDVEAEIFPYRGHLRF